MFDRYFADQVPSWRRRALMGASLTLHGLFGLAVLTWSWAQVSHQTSEVPLTFFAPPPPPRKATPAAAPVKKKALTPKSKVTRSARIDPLIRQRVTQNTPQPLIEASYEPDAVEGAAPGGAKGGAVGGTGKMVPQFLAQRQKLNAPDPHLPDWFRQQHPHETLTGTYRVCVNVAGRVIDVQAMTGIAGVDRIVGDQILANWTFKTQPIPFCYINQLKFQIN
jgi:hypothetical protein